jgi:hypothetical protein
MNFETTFPLIYLMNLSRREDRRVQCEWLFEQHGLKVERFPAVDALWMKNARGYESKGRRAHVLSTLLILREAKRRRAPAVFIFEDDVVLAPHWREQLAKVSLPEDWRMFTLGGQHHERPKVLRPGLIKVAAMLDTHAWGVRAEAYDEIISALLHSAADDRGYRPATDVTLARRQSEIPTYAPFPNLAWQAESASDLAAGNYSNYQPDGWPKPGLQVLPGLLSESLGGPVWQPAKAAALRQRAWFQTAETRALPREPEALAETKQEARFQRLAFLFLTRGAHHRPELWEDYWKDSDACLRYAHISGRDARPGGWLEAARITEWVPTQWGHISLVRAQLALLRAALAEPENSHFVFCSESCIPIRPLADLETSLRLDPRSRFPWETHPALHERMPEKAARAAVQPRIPASQWAFHSQWILLNREAAELVIAHDFTRLFENTIAPDECYFGTVLHLCGYPLEEKVAPREVTWTRWQQGAHPEAIAEISPAQRAEWLESGKFFARKISPAGTSPVTAAKP